MTHHQDHDSSLTTMMMTHEDQRTTNVETNRSLQPLAAAHLQPASSLQLNAQDVLSFQDNLPSPCPPLITPHTTALGHNSPNNPFSPTQCGAIYPYMPPFAVAAVPASPRSPHN